MQAWMPKPVWKGKDCFILGGGPSLDGWDFDLLKSERVVGCNHAFRHGPEVCDYLVFADMGFFSNKDVYKGLEAFPNPVITNQTRLYSKTEPWLKLMKKYPRGFHMDGLGYNNNTGAVAINLALLLGAQWIYLLGFDMHLDKEGRSNYHNHQISKPSPNIYRNMLAHFTKCKKDLQAKFPGRHIFNVTSCSSLVVFPQINFDRFWKDRKIWNGCKRTSAS